MLGKHRQTITVIRSLGKAGYLVIVGKEKPAFPRNIPDTHRKYGGRSKYLNRRMEMFSAGVGLVMTDRYSSRPASTRCLRMRWRNACPCPFRSIVNHAASQNAPPWKSSVTRASSSRTTRVRRSSEKGDRHQGKQRTRAEAAGLADMNGFLFVQIIRDRVSTQLSLSCRSRAACRLFRAACPANQPAGLHGIGCGQYLGPAIRVIEMLGKRGVWTLGDLAGTGDSIRCRELNAWGFAAGSAGHCAPRYRPNFISPGAGTVPCLPSVGV